MLGGDKTKAIDRVKIMRTLIYYAKNLGFLLGDGEPRRGLM